MLVEFLSVHLSIHNLQMRESMEYFQLLIVVMFMCINGIPILNKQS